MVLVMIRRILPFSIVKLRPAIIAGFEVRFGDVGTGHGFTEEKR